MMKIFLFFICFSSIVSGFAQSQFKGIVKDKNNDLLFGVNVYLESNIEIGTVTDFDGRFHLKTITKNDTIVFSFIGYKIKKIKLNSINFNKLAIIILEENEQVLEEVILKSRDPISQNFSAVKISKMDIYLNPVSQGDPLKAISILPASTTTNETANPSLRGSSSSRSRVVLNGVPVYKPVRASQINNQGFFSVFNPEIIDKQYVYASNPPLTFGNTSAGLVEIQTTENIDSNSLKLSLGLSSLGLFVSKKFNNDLSFIQAYTNYQFSNAYINIQKKNLPNISNFKAIDAGINLYTKIGKKISLNSFNYFIDESFKGFGEIFTYKGDLNSSNKRVFTINTLDFYTKKGVFSYKNGVNYSIQKFAFGNTGSNNKTNEFYNSISYRAIGLSGLKLQFGISSDYHKNEYDDKISQYYYSLSPSSQFYETNTSISNHMLESYGYFDWRATDRLNISTGLRGNIPTNTQKKFFSYQLGLRFKLSDDDFFLLSGGKYHNYSIPNYFFKKYNLLSSKQLALDYSFMKKKTKIKSAFYLKEEEGEIILDEVSSVNKINTLGVEIYFEQDFFNHFSFTLSNSFINQSINLDNVNYVGQKDFNYFVKSGIQYNNSKLANIALTYIGRPGTHYTSVIGSTYNFMANSYEPIFNSELYNEQYSNYNRFDLSINKYFNLEKTSLIAFLSVNNLFNAKNEKEPLYNFNYSGKRFENFQLRTIYFGVVWNLGSTI